MHLTMRMLAALAALMLPILASRPASQLRAADGEEIVAGKTFAAGTMLTAKIVGTSFKVPKACEATLHADSWFVALKFENEKIVGVAHTMTGVHETDAEDFLSQAIDFKFIGSDVAASPKGRPQTEGRKTTVAYEGEGIVGAGIVLRGESDNAIAVVIAGAETEAQSIKAALESIEESVVFAKPSEEERKAWLGRLSGHKLTVDDKEHDITLVVDFANDGTFHFNYTVRGQSQLHDGKWQLEFGTQGAIVILRNDQISQRLKLIKNGEILTAEGYPAKLSGGAALRKPGDPAPGLKKVGGDFKSDIKEVDKLDGKDIQPDVRYDEGTQLKIALLGMSFKVPAGCIGGVTPTVNYVLVRPNDQRGLGTIAMQTGVSGIDEIAAMLAGAKDLSALEQGLVIEPDGEPKVSGGKATLRYTSANYVCYSIGLVGPSRNAAVISFIGPKDDDAKVKAYAEGIMTSMQFAKPDDEAQRKQWNEGLKGYCLHYFNYRSAKDNSWDSTTNIKIHFGSDNTFYYTYQHEGTVGVRDNPGSHNPITSRGVSGNDDQAQGTWRLEFTVIGALVYLTTDKGEVFPLLITVGKQIYVNGEEVSRVQSDKKK